jgi:hypothetical protein
MFNPHLQHLLAQSHAEDLRRDANRAVARELRSQRQSRSAAQTQVSPRPAARRLIAQHRH